jgi:hypothetical protein
MILAVFGYNLPQQNEMLRTAGLALEPDLVMYGYCPNDDELPYYLRVKKNVLSFESFIKYYYDVVFLPGRGMFANLFRPASEAELGAHYAEHVARSGDAGFQRALGELGRLCAAANVPVVLFTFRKGPRLDILPETVVPVSGREAVARLGKEFALSDGDTHHPSRDGHAALADLLLQGLQESGLLHAVRAGVGKAKAR